MVESVVKQKFFEIVDNYINNKKISHAYLIEIGNYEEDFLDVLEFVKMILCNCTKDNLKNDKTNIGNLIDTFNYPDLKIIEADGQWIKKNQLVELIDDFQNKSLLDNKRIYIIKEAEKLNSSSANTILKFLEEPEENIVAILLTKNRFQVIETILSRCQLLTLGCENENYNIDDNVKLFLDYLIHKNELFINYGTIVTEVMPDKNQAKIILNEISQVIISYINYSSNKEYACSVEVINLLQGVELKFLTNVLSIIEEEIAKLEYNVNYKLWLDCLFARIILES